ncbi:hypothetical protein NC653_032096 [Populus alba x Populus x berolinensis]|uniref:Uncharacterized protein n=1 Tax=Populus alba x Populus x berolinensis TaxID=444605 RepID=A0AAD6LR23_9ROSI|nr:hypothetical protein NC653_032096 [Populus alba x Populus x berolinensis]
MDASAFGEDQSGGSATRLTVEDLKYLFMFWDNLPINSLYFLPSISVKEPIQPKSLSC